MKLLVSACLLGLPCRYDGASKRCGGAQQLLKAHDCIPVCPEQLGGLPTPRPSAEIRCGGVFTADGADVTAQYRRGAALTLELYRMLGCEAAVLKERSPSCGSGLIHDGTFHGGLIPGDGLAAALLKAHSVPVYGETELEALLGGASDT